MIKQNKRKEGRKIDFKKNGYIRIYHRITFLPLLYMVHPKLVNNLEREKVYMQSQWLKNQVHQQPFCGVRAFRVRERERERGGKGIVLPELCHVGVVVARTDGRDEEEKV